MSLYNFLSGFSYASIGSVLIPIVASFLSRRSDKLKPALLALFFVSLFSDTVNEIYVAYGMKGYLIINIFFVAQFTVLSLIYVLLLSNKKWVYFSLAFLLTAFIVNCIFFQSVNEYQTTIITLESILLLSFALKYFIEVYRLLPTHNLMTYFPMWINLAVFFYFSFNLFLFALANYVFKNASQEVGMIFWGFHNFNNIAKNLVFATGIYICLIREQK